MMIDAYIILIGFLVGVVFTVIIFITNLKKVDK